MSKNCLGKESTCTSLFHKYVCIRSTKFNLIDLAIHGQSTRFIKNNHFFTLSSLCINIQSANFLLLNIFWVPLCQFFTTKISVIRYSLHVHTVAHAHSHTCACIRVHTHNVYIFSHNRKCINGSFNAYAHMLKRTESKRI